MSPVTHHSDQLPAMQEVDLNDTAWNEVVSTRLPATLEAQAGVWQGFLPKTAILSC